MNILFFSPSETDACSFYRGVGPLSQLSRRGHITLNKTKEVNWASIAGNDLCFMQRPYAKGHLEIAEIVRRQMPLWIDYDDDLFNLPFSNPAYEHFTKNVESLTKIINLASIITVTTSALADSIREHLAKDIPIQVLPNAYNDYWFPIEPSSPREKVVYWRGGETHAEDLLSIYGPLVEVASDCPDWTFIFQGMCPWMFKDTFPLKWLSSEDIMKFLPSIQHSIKPAIQIVPLADNKFNRSKSNIAWIEGTSAGAAVLAPDWPEWQHPGITNYTDADDFQSQLIRLITSEGARLHNASQSLNKVKDSLLLSQTNNQRQLIIDDLRNF